MLFRRAGLAKPLGQQLILAGGAILIALSILVHPNNHDEGQYVAAVALMRTGLPYRDFPYLQTPLQPLLLSPLAAIPAGWLLVALRAANGLFALLTSWLLLRQLRGRVGKQGALVAVAVLLFTDAFLLAASNARNDALPMLLLTAAQGAMLAVASEERQRLPALLAGLLFGLAVSTKISAALPAAGATVYLLLRARRSGLSAFLLFVGGAIVGLLPSLVLALLTPGQFRFDVFSYSLDAPRQWWTSIGQAERLEPLYRVLHLSLLSLAGVIAVGLAATALDRRPGEERRLLDLLVVGGTIGCYLPEPAFAQYLVPLLPAVTARLAFAIDDLRPVPRRLALAAVGCAAILGITPTVRDTVAAARGGPDLVRSVQAGRAVAVLAGGRPVATLSPERMAGADVNLDPRFATGPFLFRTFGPLAADALRYGLSPGWQQVRRTALDRSPPQVIVTGGEPRLDGFLRTWAISRGYRAVSLPGGQLTAYLRPATSTRIRSASSSPFETRSARPATARNI